MFELETERLRLREFTLDDVSGLAVVDTDPEVMRYIGKGVPYTLDQTEAGVRRMIEHHHRCGYGMYALVYKETGELIGRCGFKFWDDLGQLEEGWLLARSYWGKGLALEAASAVMDFGFTKKNFSEIVAMIDRANLASVKLAKKLGMAFDREIDFGYKTTDSYKIERAEYFRRKATTP